MEGMELTAKQWEVVHEERKHALESPSLGYVRGLTSRLNDAKQRLIKSTKGGNAYEMREIAEEIALLKTIFNKAVGDDIEKFYQSEATA